ncbi:M20/M25/M40 family metallo-hydrolase, partial [Candidatus Dojkabacteria bacterium]|nr:M20/M25/M40 family metallo-hydrolase [Candidatus Dojkabacteria bacterium]
MDISEYKKLLSEIIKLKSISTDSQYKDDVLKTAEWIKQTLVGYGFEAQTITEGKMNPYVVASYKVSDDAETVLIYGHYDVQPASKEDGWSSDPFELTERKGKLIARGAIDNKGQFMVHLYTIGKLIKQGKLKYNVKFLIEGNEETGNTEIGDFIAKNLDLLAADYVMVSDGETTADRPTIDVGFRGNVSLTVTYRTAKNNLHSGIYGGAAPSAPMELAKLITKIYNDKNQVSYQSFYNGVAEVTQEELENNKSIPFDMSSFTNQTGIRQLKTEEGIDFFTQTGLRPMITVSGIQSGYTGEGYSNIVPGTAFAKINIRLVANQDPEKVIQDFTKFVEDNTPEYVDWDIESESPCKAIKMDTSSAKFQEVKELAEKAYGDTVLFKYVGGSIPVINDFKEKMGQETISVSMAGEDCNMHGIDENFSIDLLEKG